MTEYSTIRVEREGELAWLVLDRPKVLNALSGVMLAELGSALQGIARSEAKALVIKGEGRAFSSGADLKSLITDTDLTDAGEIRSYMGRWRGLILALKDLPMPSVAVVGGPAYGGGANLALACDVVIAADDALICQSYVDRGVVTDLGGSYLLPRLVGWGRARYLLMTGTVVTGREAASMGMVMKSVPAGQLIDEARAVALTLAAKAPGVAVAMRHLLEAGSTGTLADALDREGDEVARLLTGEEFQSRLGSFGSGD